MKLKSLLYTSFVALSLASAAQADLRIPSQTGIIDTPSVTLKPATIGINSVTFSPDTLHLANIKPIAGYDLATAAPLKVASSAEGFLAEQKPFLELDQAATDPTVFWAAVKPIAGIPSYETLAFPHAVDTGMWDTTGASVQLSNIKPIADSLRLQVNALN
jgi:hypothetical protein